MCQWPRRHYTFKSENKSSTETLIYHIEVLIQIDTAKRKLNKGTQLSFLTQIHHCMNNNSPETVASTPVRFEVSKLPREQSLFRPNSSDGNPITLIRNRRQLMSLAPLYAASFLPASCLVDHLATRHGRLSTQAAV